MTWLVLVLLTAFFTAVQDVCGKMVLGRVDAAVVSWAWVFFSLPALAVAVFVTGIPVVDFIFWRTLIFSSMIMVIASVFYFKAIQASDLSIAVPMLTFTPLLLLLTSPIILREYPSPGGMAGVVLIFIGAYVLHLQQGRQGFWGPVKNLMTQRGCRYMLTVAALFSVSSNLDKVGVLHSSPFMWIFSLNSALSLALGMIMVRKIPGVGHQIKKAWPWLAGVGLCHGLALMFQMTAITMTLVPYLIAVKRTSVIMTSLFGLFLFKEKGAPQRLTAAFLMVLGVFVISLFQK